MGDVKPLIDELIAVAKNPSEQLDAWVASGKKAIGVLPYYAPEEIVYAAGMLPFGIWGAEVEVAKAKQYFPPFYCSIAQSSLELGLSGKLDKLSGVMISTLCDTLKPLTQNWRLGVPSIPLITVSQPQNRKLTAGFDYVKSSYEEIKSQIEDIASVSISEENLRNAIEVYNSWRSAMRAFVVAAGKAPGLCSATERGFVVRSAYYMDKKEHTEKVRALTKALEEAEADAWSGKKVVVSGIHADMGDLLGLFDDFDLAIVADDLAKESRSWAQDVTLEGNAVDALAAYFCSLDCCSILFDPEKKRADYLVGKVQANEAQGVVFVLAKFCDPEEFDLPIMQKTLESAGIPNVVIEVDQQMQSFEQARTALQAFAEIVG